METEADFEYLKYMTDSTDPKAILQDLMTAYGNDVWNYAFSITRKWEMADDITQDVFLKAYRNLFTFRSESSVKTWLLAITRNTAYDYKKSAFFRKVTLVDYITFQGSSPSAETEVIQGMESGEIWKLVLRLPAKYREVLILYGHYQLSMREIAKVLDLNEGTVKSRLRRARAKGNAMKGAEKSE